LENFPAGQLTQFLPSMNSLAEQRLASSALPPKLKQEVDPQEFPPLQSRVRDLD
jgi:hypothetical protein